MCGQHGTADQLLVIHDAAAVVEEFLGPLARDSISKALDLGSSRGFDRAVALLAGRLRGAVGTVDADAVRAAIEVLDVDWAATTAAQRSRLLAEATTAARRMTAIIPARIRAPFDEAATSVIGATRTEARRDQGLGTVPLGPGATTDRRCCPKRRCCPRCATGRFRTTAANQTDPDGSGRTEAHSRRKQRFQ